MTSHSTAQTNSPREILVSGATGQQGGAVARSLLQRGFHVRGLSRDPSKSSGGLDPRIHWVEGNLQDAASLETALRGAAGFYLVTTPFVAGSQVPPDVEGEVRSGAVALEAAQRAKTPQVVMSTVMGLRGLTQPIGIPHLDSKLRIEQTARALGLPITIVRPSFFMENFFQPWVLGPLRAGVVSAPLKPTTKVPMVAVQDIGEIVARAFEQPERRIGTEVDLQAEANTYPEAVALLNQRLGTSARFVEMSDEDALRFIGPDMQKMFRGFDRGVPRVDVAALERDWNIKMTRLDTLVKETKFPTPG
jgi:uncharacterized protein YbjT (DUF2867 family)